jgi:putative ABC transport system permease protein
MPLSYLSAVTLRFYSKPFELQLQMRPGASADDLASKVKAFLTLKYGRSVNASVDSDQLLLAQLRKFLTLFALLLSGVAFMSLAVGGIGITNMMLASVAERFKEIGLRKALGANDREIRSQFLAEALLLSLLAGVAGVLVGIAGYESLLYLGSKLSNKIAFEWVFNSPALLLASISIIGVGIASGLVPALRAEKLEVVEALRSE